MCRVQCSDVISLQNSLVTDLLGGIRIWKYDDTNQSVYLVLNFVKFITSQTFQVIWESIPSGLHWCKTGREYLKDNPEAA